MFAKSVRQENKSQNCFNQKNQLNKQKPHNPHHSQVTAIFPDAGSCN